MEEEEVILTSIARWVSSFLGGDLSRGGGDMAPVRYMTGGVLLLWPRPDLGTKAIKRSCRFLRWKETKVEEVKGCKS